MSSAIDDARALLARLPPPRLISTRGGLIECLVTGEGPAVLALHGGAGGFDQGALLALSAIGASGCTLVAPSRPGYLGTPLSAGPSPEQQADLYADLLDALALPDVAVIAVSGGGPSALAFALRHRARCRALVLVSACTARLAVRLPWRFHLMKLLARSARLVRLLARRTRDPERAARRAVADPQARGALLADSESCALFVALGLTVLDRLAARLPGTENDIRHFSAREGYALEQVGVPILAVHGTADRVVAFSHAQGVAARVPGAALMAIDGGEHVCLFTHRAAIRFRVHAFLGIPDARDAHDATERGDLTR